MIYDHTQKSIGITTTSLVIAGLILTALAFYTGLSLLFSLVFIISLLIILIFTSLTIQICNGQLSWYFGPGFWKKEIELREIVSVHTIRIKWYYGFGIRLIPTGWMYNVSGLDAVQIKLKNSKIITLGTDEPEKLLNSLESEISS